MAIKTRIELRKKDKQVGDYSFPIEVKVTIYICPFCFTDSRYLITIQKHMAEKHTQDLNKFI